SRRPPPLRLLLPRAAGRAYSEHEGQRKERAGRRVGKETSPERKEFRAADPEFRLERSDPRLQRLVLFARQPRHFFDRLEFLAPDHVEIAQDAVRLTAEDGIELTPHARGGAGCVVHQPRHLIDETVACLGHRWSRDWILEACRTMVTLCSACKGARSEPLIADRGGLHPGRGRLRRPLDSAAWLPASPQPGCASRRCRFMSSPSQPSI